MMNPLPGEASPDEFSVTDSSGLPSDLGHTVFPILRQKDDESLSLIGTGFWITADGLFVTARHVLLDVLDDSGKQRHPLLLVHFTPDNKYHLRPILRSVQHETADISVGLAAPLQHRKTGSFLPSYPVTLTALPPARGVRVFTFAYPKHRFTKEERAQTLEFFPAFYKGTLQEYLPQGRDSVMLPTPCYQTTITSHGGASGGPVFAPSGWVFGINSTGFGDDLSYATRINEILPLALDNPSPARGAPTKLRMLELIALGAITFEPPLSSIPALLLHLGHAGNAS